MALKYSFTIMHQITDLYFCIIPHEKYVFDCSDLSFNKNRAQTALFGNGAGVFRIGKNSVLPHP